MPPALSLTDPKGVGSAKRWPLYALVAVMFGAMLMRLLPLLEFSLWGSDWGEYFHLTDRLVQDGYHPETNLGWGRAYVDFPGLFDLTGTVALVAGVGAADAMLLVIPCVTAISCLLVACIVLRLDGSIWAALVAAGMIALLFPVVFTASHPVPGPLGSVLVMGVMLVFLTGDVWRRDADIDAVRPMVLYTLILLLLFVLTVTHHLSMFFVIIVLSLTYLLRSVMMKGHEPERAFFGLWSITAALALATVYWLMVAKTFSDEVMVDLAGVSGNVMMGLAWVGLVLMVVLGRFLSKRDKRIPTYPFWGRNEILVAMGVYVVAATVILGLVTAFGFPGTDIEPAGHLVIYALPTVAVFALLIGSTDVVLRRHGGLVVVAWIVALTVSFLVASVYQSVVLVPYRHVPYIVEVSAVLIGIGAVHLYNLWDPRSPTTTGSDEGTKTRRRRAVRLPTVALAVMVVILLVATAYPPKDVMGGFQEGTVGSELDAMLWLREGLPGPGAVPEDLGSGTVATDHRLSSMVFGIGGQMATWDTAGPVLYGKADAETWAAMEDIDTPNGDRRVTAIVLSEDLRTGAALSQVDTPRPVEGEAWDKFFEPPFIRVYDGGDVWVMYVVRPLDTNGEL